jgi:hypothetical protein
MTYQVENRFQSLPFKCNLQRYTAEADHRDDYDIPVMYGDGMGPTPGIGDDKKRGVTLVGRDAWWGAVQVANSVYYPEP